jgi:hypothetical protein
MADHGTRQSYADGCRCPSCKAAQSKYRRDLKARNAGATVTSIAPPGRRPKGAPAPVPVVAVPQLSSEPGGAEQAVLEELALLTSAETRKGAAQAAIALARILDNPLALPQQPQAAAKLVAILDDLRKGSARRKGRLASVQAMTRPGGGKEVAG